MRSLYLAVLVVLAVPVASFASDLFLQWDDCAPAGVGLKTFACNTNSGTQTLVMSFVLETPMTDFDGAEGAIAVIYPSSTAPSWWNIGGCRPTSVLQLAASGGGSCANPWPEGSVGGVSWETQYQYWPWSRLRAVKALPGATTLAAGVHYEVFRLTVSHVQSTGTGSCGGCELPAALVPRALQLYTPDPAHDQFVGIAYETRNDLAHYARWQCDGTPEYEWDGFFTGWTFGSGCTVPTRRTTWGSVKSLYR